MVKYMQKIKLTISRAWLRLEVLFAAVGSWVLSLFPFCRRRMTCVVKNSLIISLMYMYVIFWIWIVYAGQYWDKIPPQYYLLPLQINLQHVCFFHVHLGHVTLSFQSLDLTDPEYSHCIFRGKIVSPSDKSNLLLIFYFTNGHR